MRYPEITGLNGTGVLQISVKGSLFLPAEQVTGWAPQALGFTGTQIRYRAHSSRTAEHELLTFPRHKQIFWPQACELVISTECKKIEILTILDLYLNKAGLGKVFGIKPAQFNSGTRLVREAGYYPSSNNTLRHRFTAVLVRRHFHLRAPLGVLQTSSSWKMGTLHPSPESTVSGHSHLPLQGGQLTSRGFARGNRTRGKLSYTG